MYLIIKASTNTVHAYEDEAPKIEITVEGKHEALSDAHDAMRNTYDDLQESYLAGGWNVDSDIDIMECELRCEIDGDTFTVSWKIINTGDKSQVELENGL